MDKEQQFINETKSQLQFLEDLVAPITGTAKAAAGVPQKLGRDIQQLLISIFGGKPSPEVRDASISASDKVGSNWSRAVEPFRRTGEMIRDAVPDIRSALGGEADDAPQGALPNIPMGPPRPSNQTRPGVAPVRGALSSRPGSRQAAQPTQQPALAIDAGPAPVEMETAPEGQPQNRRSIQSFYQDLLSKINKKADTSLSPEQRENAEKMFYATLMSGGTPAGMGPSNRFGEASKASLEYADKQTNLNRASEAARIQNERGEAVNIANLMDKDSDNERLDRRTAIEDKRYQALDKREQEKLLLERQKLEREGKRVVGHQTGGNGNILFLLGDGTIKDSGVKARATGEGEPADIRKLRLLMADPKLQETYKNVYGKEGKDDLRAALLKGVAEGGDPEDLAMKLLRGDAILRGGSSGALPPGIPAGSTAIGTAKDGPMKGKTVYRTPDGKQMVAK